MSATTSPADLAALLQALHTDLARALAVRPSLADEPRELDTFICGLVERLLPAETEPLFRLAASYPPLLHRPLAPELLEEEELPETAAACLALNLRFFCYSSLHSEAAQERLAPAPGEQPGLLDDLRLCPPAGPAPGLRRIEQGTLADFDEWLHAVSPARAAEDARAAISHTAAAWIPDAHALRAWLDLVCAPGSAWLAEREIDDEPDELSSLDCLRSNLHGYLISLLQERLDREAVQRPELAAALHAWNDLSGRDATIGLLCVLPDPALTCARAGVAAPGAAAALVLAPDPGQAAALGLRLTGSAWRFQSPDALAEGQREQAARLARDERALVLCVELSFAVTDGARLREQVAEAHGHPGEDCDNDPSPSELAGEALRAARGDDAESFGVLVLQTGRNC